MPDQRRFGTVAPAGPKPAETAAPRMIAGPAMAAGRAPSEIELSDEPNPPPPDKVWGYHLLVDCSGCNDKIDDIATIEQFFEELISETGMKPMSQIMIKSDIKEDDRGTSATQLITTSSITYHSDDEQRCIYLDFFSCKTFDPQVILATLKKFFAPQRIDDMMVHRDAGYTDKTYRSEKLP